jgi:DNA-binding transcriptional regulator GbsR (MarR family)
MNNMKSKDSNQAFRQLSLSIGDFIRYWGFRRIHGAIWTQLYLSKEPLSGVELTQRLKLSKALVSPALLELKKWGLIKDVESKNAKTKLFAAEADVNQVIKRVLKIREKKMIDKIGNNLGELKDSGLENLNIDEKRLEQLTVMVASAQMMLAVMLETEDFTSIPMKVDPL